MTTPVANRKRLPVEREAVVHRFEVGGQKGYIVVGLYSDQSPGEVFLHMAKEGSTSGGLMDTIGVLFSLALQHGVPLATICAKLRHTRFDPQGVAIGRREISQATSIADYIAHWMSLRFLADEEREAIDQSAPKGPTT